MQLTRNVSLYRLLVLPLEEVLAARGEYEALGAADCEVLPHLNRHDPPFLETVRRYSEHVPHDIVALADGAALLCSADGELRCAGAAVRFRGGVSTPLEDSP
jgi:hypothetical protein